MKIAVLTAIILFFGGLAWAESPTKHEIKAHIRECARELKVDPAFCIAVAQVESGLKTGPLGKRGRYFGPFGIERSFLKRWDISDWRENCYRGVAALRGKSKRRVLQRYNKSFNLAYFKAVKQVEAQEQVK